VTSLWYRAPEVLLGARCCDRLGRAAAPGGYGLAADAWAFGVLTSEWLRKGEPLLSGHSELDQLQRIFRLLGAPTVASWPALFDGVSIPHARLVQLPASAELTMDALDVATGASVRMPRSQLRRLLPLRGYDPAVPSTAQLTTTGLSSAGFECVAGCLELDPRRRPLASDAQRHRWFAEPPLAESLTRFDMRALSRARTAAVSSGAHAISIALQSAQRAAVAAAPIALMSGAGGQPLRSV
jgi:serine/threonine protein kinase